MVVAGFVVTVLVGVGAGPVIVVVVAGFDAAGGRVRDGVDEAVGRVGRTGAVAAGAGVSLVSASAAGAGSESMSGSSPDSARAALSTGDSATEESTMLVAVARHQPATGTHLEDRTKPSSHQVLWLSPWR
ncbi:hypothetical protein GCM10025331_18770 [Actinoplanes utahensis]|nr:hypothetical protein Aut01nite_25980 [Actinoplanes utahensis]